MSGLIIYIITSYKLPASLPPLLTQLPQLYMQWLLTNLPPQPSFLLSLCKVETLLFLKRSSGSWGHRISGAPSPHILVRCLPGDPQTALKAQGPIHQLLTSSPGKWKPSCTGRDNIIVKMERGPVGGVVIVYYELAKTFIVFSGCLWLQSNTSFVFMQHLSWLYLTVWGPLRWFWEVVFISVSLAISERSRVA